VLGSGGPLLVVMRALPAPGRRSLALVRDPAQPTRRPTWTSPGSLAQTCWTVIPPQIGPCRWAAGCL